MQAITKKQSITRLIEKLNRLLDAEKLDFKTGEILADNGTQIQAIKTLAAMLSDNKPAHPSPARGP